MASVFLDTLNLSERTAYPFVRQAVREGLSSRNITELLISEFGRAIRRQRLLEMIRFENLEETLGAQLKYLRRDARPDPARLPDALTKIRRNYSFDVEVRGILEESGLASSQFVTVTTDAILTRAELEDAGLDAVEEGASRYGLTAVSAVLTTGRRAGAAGRF